MTLFDFRWPDQINLEEFAEAYSVDYLAGLIQLRQYSSAEALLLASPQLSEQNYQYLLALLQIRQSRLSSFRALSQSWPMAWTNTIESKILRVFAYLRNRDLDELKRLTEEFWLSSDSLQDELQHQLLLVRAMVEFSIGRREVSALILEGSSSYLFVQFRGNSLRTRLYASEFKFDEALALLLPAIRRFPQHEIGAEFLCELTLAARSQTETIPAIRYVMNQGHKSESIYRSASQIQILQNQLADARKTSLQERVMCSFTGLKSESISNLPNIYDRLGNVDWLDYLHPIMTQTSPEFMLIRQNLAMQYASYGSRHLEQHLIDLERDLIRTNELRMYPRATKSQAISSGRQKISPLTIAWCSSDLAYHPVCRFIYSIFANSVDLKHQHIIVDTFDHKGETKRALFEEFEHISVCNPRGHTEIEKIAEIQDLKADVAVDLSGWTGSHFQAGFLSHCPSPS